MSDPPERGRQERIPDGAVKGFPPSAGAPGGLPEIVRIVGSPDGAIKGAPPSAGAPGGLPEIVRIAGILTY